MNKNRIQNCQARDQLYSSDTFPYKVIEYEATIEILFRYKRCVRYNRARQGEVPDLGQGEGHRQRRVVRAMRTVSFACFPVTSQSLMHTCSFAYTQFVLPGLDQC